MTVIDGGRGPGGRAGTRVSREDGRVRVDHGVGSFTVREDGVAADFLRKVAADMERIDGGTAIRAVTGGVDSRLHETATDTWGTWPSSPSSSPLPPSPPADAGASVRYVAGDEGIAALGRHLLDSSKVETETAFKTQVTEATLSASGKWTLRSKTGLVGLPYDYLIVSSLTPSHTRHSEIFNAAPPMVAPTRGDARGEELVGRMEKVVTKGVVVVMGVVGGEGAKVLLR